MNDYEAKLEAKRQRLTRASENAASEAASKFDRAARAVDGIPFGQPILVGHHSEKRHRGALRRHDAAMRGGIEAGKRSKELADRAAAVGTGGISSDDPDAVEKLTDKRTGLELERDAMKAANAFYKKQGTLEGWDGPEKLKRDGLVTLRVQSYYNAPFPSYALSNIGARIRRAAKRSGELSARDPEAPADVEQIGSATITSDPLENRVLLAFPERLSKENYKRVRSAGFVWSPTRSAFVRKLSDQATYQARELAHTLEPITTGEER